MNYLYIIHWYLQFLSILVYTHLCHKPGRIKRTTQMDTDSYSKISKCALAFQQSNIDVNSFFLKPMTLTFRFFLLCFLHAFCKCFTNVVLAKTSL